MASASESGEGIPEGSERRNSRMVYLLAYSNQPDPNGEPNDSNSNVDSSDRDRCGRRGKTFGSDHKNRGKKKTSRRNCIRNCLDSDTNQTKTSESEEDFSDSDENVSNGLRDSHHRSGKWLLKRLKPFDKVSKKDFYYRSYGLLKTSAQYDARVVEKIGSYHKKLDVQLKRQPFSGSDSIVVLGFSLCFKIKLMTKG